MERRLEAHSFIEKSWEEEEDEDGEDKNAESQKEITVERMCLQHQ